MWVHGISECHLEALRLQGACYDVHCLASWEGCQRVPSCTVHVIPLRTPTVPVIHASHRTQRQKQQQFAMLSRSSSYECSAGSIWAVDQLHSSLDSYRFPMLRRQIYSTLGGGDSGMSLEEELLPADALPAGPPAGIIFSVSFSGIATKAGNAGGGLAAA